MKRLTINLGLSFILFIIIQICTLLNVQGQQIIHSAVHSEIIKLGLKPIGRVAPTTKLRFLISLPIHNQSELNILLQQIYNPNSPNYHHYLTPDQFTAQFGPTKQDYQSVINFAKANGFTITRTSKSNRLLSLTGTVSNIERVLHVKMLNYRHPKDNRIFYAPDSDPSINLTTPVLAILGLNNYSKPKPCMTTSANSKKQVNSTGTGSGINGSYKGRDYRAAYVPDIPPSLNGSGQKLGILLMGDFNSSDITTYEQISQMNPIPTLTPTKVIVDAVIGTTADSIEGVADIDMAIAMAPGLSEIRVYEGSSFDVILDAMATEDNCNTISMSYVNLGYDDANGEIYLQQMAVQGQSFFCASGDWGAYTTQSDTEGFESAPFPAGSPNATVVGGTDLYTTGPGGSYISEDVYNYGYSYKGYPFYTVTGNAGGGGIDSGGTFISSIPVYQQNIPYILSAGGSNNYRNFPDVAMVATNNEYVLNNTEYYGRGTSFSAPLWAAFTALVNQQRAQNGRNPIGFLNQVIYPIGKGNSSIYNSTFHDIISGNINFPGNSRNYTAGSGYDLCTGWGSPNGQTLINFFSGPIWSGTHTIASNCTVSSGQSLIILPGTTVQLASGASLIVDGNLIAIGTSSQPVTFTSTGGASAGSWGSIVFSGSSSSNSTISYANIQYGDEVQFTAGANATIENSTIQNCTQGVYVYNSAPQILSNQIIDPIQNGIYLDAAGFTPIIISNKIKKNSTNSQYLHYQGIYSVSNSTPRIANNDIQGFDYGVYLGGGTNSTFTDASNNTPQPNNRFTGNIYGLTVGWGSTVAAGQGDVADWDNSIYNNSNYDLEAYDSSSAIANFDYWGSNPHYYNDGTSSIDVSYPLSSDPWGGIPLKIAVGNKLGLNKITAYSGLEKYPSTVQSGSSLTDILTGLSLEEKGEIDSAIAFYDGMIKSGSHPEFALTELLEIGNKYPSKNILSYFQSILPNTEYVAEVSKLTADMFLENGQFSNAIAMYDNIIKNYPTDYSGIDSRFDELFAYINYKNNLTVAKQILTGIESLNLIDVNWTARIAMADNLLGLPYNGMVKKSAYTTASIPKSYSLFQNYPNPFNPSTIIHYEIPNDGLVTLKIYDELGREVKTLVNQYQSKGRYDVSFNASQLASGIYFYQLRSLTPSGKNYISTKKMMLLK